MNWLIIASSDITADGGIIRHQIANEDLTQRAINIESLAKLELFLERFCITDLIRNPGNLAIDAQGKVTVIDFKVGVLAQNISHSPRVAQLRTNLIMKYPGDTFQEQKGNFEQDLESKKEELKPILRNSMTVALRKLEEFNQYVVKHNEQLKGVEEASPHRIGSLEDLKDVLHVEDKSILQQYLCQKGGTEDVDQEQQLAGLSPGGWVPGDGRLNWRTRVRNRGERSGGEDDQRDRSFAEGSLLG